MAEQPAQSTAPKQLLLQKIYVKDLSFESPKAPGVFNTTVTPQTQLNMRSSAREVAPNTQEVTLTLTVEAKDRDATLFLVEVAQAGIFTIQGYNDQERAMIVGSYCPSTLYPYAREAISDVVVKGGFPQLLLQPINFDALYAQALQQRAQQQGVQPPTMQQATIETQTPPSGQQDSKAADGESPAEPKAGETH
ncbi:MAG TPA: protein-export chaperone SecB [Gammaproteobacteria bacterium]